jgi:hypothetical protein
MTNFDAAREIRLIHEKGGRAIVTYRKDNGDTAKGLALDDPQFGVGDKGAWFVCVDNFANRVPLLRITAVKLSKA